MTTLRRSMRIATRRFTIRYDEVDETAHIVFYDAFSIIVGGIREYHPRLNNEGITIKSRLHEGYCIDYNCDPTILPAKQRNYTGRLKEDDIGGLVIIDRDLYEEEGAIMVQCDDGEWDDRGVRVVGF